MAKIKKTGRHTSALRENRRAQRRKDVNDKWRAAIKSIAKKISEAVSKKDSQKAQELLKEAYRILDRAAKKKVIHPNKASRKKSRLSKLVQKSLAK